MKWIYDFVSWKHKNFKWNKKKKIVPFWILQSGLIWSKRGRDSISWPRIIRLLFDWNSQKFRKIALTFTPRRLTSGLYQWGKRLGTTQLILPRIQNQSEQLASNYVNIQIRHFHFFSLKQPYNCNFKTRLFCKHLGVS